MSYIRNKYTTIFVVTLLSVLFSYTTAMPDEAALTSEQKAEAAWQDFVNTDKAVGLTTHALQEAMGNEQTKQLLGRYGDVVTIIQVEKELFHSGDLAAAARILRDKFTDKMIERIAPDFHSWLGWMKWAKTGMELFKDFVFDPMVEQSQVDTYVGLREAGNSPQDAYAGVRGLGYAVERAKKDLRKKHGDQIFKKGTNELIPEWEDKLYRYIAATFEKQYHDKLLRDAQRRAKIAADEARKQLPELRAKLAQHLRQYRIAKIEIDPSGVELMPGEQVIFSATAVYQDPSAERSAQDITGTATWHGTTDGNVLKVTDDHVGRTLGITVEYAGVTGSAKIKVTGIDCGDHGRFNAKTGECDCDSAYTYDETLGECISDEEAAAEEVEPVLGDLEYDFYDAVEIFNEHHQNFVSLLRSHAAGTAEEICADVNLAYSFTRAAVAYEIVNDLYFTALDKVGRDDTGLDWDAIGGGTYATGINVIDQIRLEMFRKDYHRVREAAESMPDELAQLAPGCDPEELLDTGAQIAETDQDAETGLEGTPTDSEFGLSANFTGSPRSGEAPLRVNFVDLSSGGEIESWEWSFGDGGTSTAQNPSYTYFEDGTYPVTLTVTDSEGLRDTENKPRFIKVGDDGNGGDGDLRFVNTGPVISELQGSDQCNGGSVNLELSNISAPSEIRADRSSTITFNVDFTYSGVGDVDVSGVVYFLNVIREIPSGELWGSGNTISITVNPSEIDFSLAAGSVYIQIGGGMMCEDESVASVTVQAAYGYSRRGGN